jgi:S-layer homology domain
MTFTIKKVHLAMAVLVVALIAPATALATHIFSDVPDSKFYADPVEWAFNNGITTGTSATTFSPEDGVTRGESVTFLKRYDDNIVQPALADTYTKSEVDAAIDSISWSESMPVSDSFWFSDSSVSWTVASGGSKAPNGLTLHDSFYGRFFDGFTLPPAYTAGQDVAVRILWMGDIDNTPGCTFRLENNGTSVQRAGQQYAAIQAEFVGGVATGSFPYVILTASNEGSVNSYLDNTVQSIDLILPGEDLAPGDQVSLAIARRSSPSTASQDSCTGGLTILGLTALPA